MCQQLLLQSICVFTSEKNWKYSKHGIIRLSFVALNVQVVCWSCCWYSVLFYQLHLWASCFTSCSTKEQRASIKMEFTNHKRQKASRYAFSTERRITEIRLDISCFHQLTSAWVDFQSFHANKVSLPEMSINFFCNWV